MDLRSLDEALDRWVTAGLIDSAQADAIAEHEAALAPAAAPPLASRISLGAVLAYAGTLVALAAVFALYVTVFQDYTERARVALTFAIAAGAGVLTLGASRFRAGWALADALGLATTLIAVWATLEAFRAAGWLGSLPAASAPDYAHALTQMRGAFLGVGVAAAVVGYLAARVLRSPLSAAASAAGAAWCAGVVVWWLAAPGHDAPGVSGGQGIVIAGGALALITLVPGVTGLGDRGRLWWRLGALGAANVAAFALALGTGGIYEGLLLAYALALGLIAVFRGGQVFLVVAAVTLYEYVGLVIFRTFQGAVAAIVVLALIGLGTAFTGAAGERIGFAWLWHWAATPRRRPPPAPPPEAPPPEELPPEPAPPMGEAEGELVPPPVGEAGAEPEGGAWAGVEPEPTEPPPPEEAVLPPSAPSEEPPAGPPPADVSDAGSPPPRATGEDGDAIAEEREPWH